jgi:hypothetical protein
LGFPDCINSATALLLSSANASITKAFWEFLHEGCKQQGFIGAQIASLADLSRIKIRGKVDPNSTSGFTVTVIVQISLTSFFLPGFRHDGRGEHFLTCGAPNKASDWQEVKLDLRTAGRARSRMHGDSPWIDFSANTSSTAVEG